MINRQKLIEAVEESTMINVFDPYRGGFDDCIKLETVVELIKSQPPADVPDTNVGEWIPCSERLPVYYDWHYVTVKPFYEGKKNYVAMERFDSRKGEWSSHERAYKDKVIAWMPLPEPYKGE